MMAESSSSAVLGAAALLLLQRFPKHPNPKYSYGTAGFRFAVDEYSKHVFVRTGMLAHFRSVYLGNKTVGLCITASHNLACDNGIKLIDPDGGMLAASWETLAAKVINAETNEECIRLLLEICSPSGPSSVLLARDTRPSSEELEACAIQGVDVWSKTDGTARSLGLATTPQLHYCVMEGNQLGYVKGRPATIQGYNDLLVDSYKMLVKGGSQSSSKWGTMEVDCANGIGGLMFPAIASKLQEEFPTKLFNQSTDDASKLNFDCGAEFVQKGQMPPSGCIFSNVNNRRFASFDGDADRLVCFYYNNHGFCLLDGDKIASLLTKFIKSQVDLLFGLDQTKTTIGTVQTAYANGSSTAYLRNVLGVEVPFVKTGVKHLHHQAQNYDVGVYFESNGHGTVLFRPSFIDRVSKTAAGGERLMGLIRLLNQATGDAMADLLAIDGILRLLGLSYQDWNEIYLDLPSKQVKVPVKDRNVIQVSEDETRCVSLPELQLILDQAMSRVESGRVFVRPSGTENVIRVYAEAKTQQDADLLAQIAKQAIEDLCNKRIKV